MSRTMLTASNTLSQLQKQMDVISHNIANVDTTGYKKQNATFTDLLVQQLNNQPDNASEIGRFTPNGIRQGSGAKLAQIMTIMTQGGLKSTGRELDVAFTKEGQFFRIQTETEREVQFTRDGSFYLTPVSNDELMLVTSDGNLVLDEDDNPIVINGQAKEYKIDPNGSLIVSMDNGTEPLRFNLGVSLVNKPQFLELKGNNLLGLPENVADLNVEIDEIVTNLIGQDRDQISIEQGVLEQSNVDLSKEMTDLIQVQRSYQFQSRSINMADQMMGLINGIR